MVNNINKNTISEILSRKDLNALNEIKSAGIKNKRLIPKQKELLNLFDDLLDTILTENKNNNNDTNTNTTTTTTTTTTNSNNGNENELENENENENENEMETENVIKQLNDCLDEMIDKSKSFED